MLTPHPQNSDSPSSTDEASSRDVSAMTCALMECMSGAAVLCTAQDEVVYRNRAAGRLLKDRATVGQNLFASEVFDGLRTRIRSTSPADADAPVNPLDVPLQPDDSLPVHLGDRWYRVTLQSLGPGTARSAKEVHMADDEHASGASRTGQGDASTPQGYVLRLQPEDRRPEAAAIPHNVLRTLIDTLREPIASVRAAIETIRLYPDMDASTASQFLQIIEEQTEMLGRRLDTAIEAYASAYRAEGPLRPVAATDLHAAVHSSVEGAVNVPVTLGEGEDDGAAILVDLQALKAVARFLAQRIENATRCASLLVRMGTVRQLVAIDLVWEGTPVTSARLREWQDSLVSWGRSIVEMTVRDVLDHHDAQIVARSESEVQHLRLLFPQLYNDAA